jgi:hypothetical protein
VNTVTNTTKYLNHNSSEANLGKDNYVEHDSVFCHQTTTRTTTKTTTTTIKVPIAATLHFICNSNANYHDDETNRSKPTRTEAHTASVTKKNIAAVESKNSHEKQQRYPQQKINTHHPYHHRQHACTWVVGGIPIGEEARYYTSLSEVLDVLHGFYGAGGEMQEGRSYMPFP